MLIPIPHRIPSLALAAATTVASFSAPANATTEAEAENSDAALPTVFSARCVSSASTRTVTLPRDRPAQSILLRATPGHGILGETMGDTGLTGAFNDCGPEPFTIQAQHNAPYVLSLTPGTGPALGVVVQCDKSRCKLERASQDLCTSFIQSISLEQGPSTLEVLVAEIIGAPRPATWTSLGEYTLTGEWHEGQCKLQGQWTRPASHATVSGLTPSWNIEGGARPLRVLTYAESSGFTLPAALRLSTQWPTQPAQEQPEAPRGRLRELAERQQQGLPSNLLDGATSGEGVLVLPTPPPEQPGSRDEDTQAPQQPPSCALNEVHHETGVLPRPPVDDTVSLLQQP